MQPVRRNIKQPQQNYTTANIYSTAPGKGRKPKLYGYYNERNARLYTSNVKVIYPE